MTDDNIAVLNDCAFEPGKCNTTRLYLPTLWIPEEQGKHYVDMVGGLQSVVFPPVSVQHNWAEGNNTSGCLGLHVEVFAKLGTLRDQGLPSHFTFP